ncbi:MAG: peptidoglycan-binding LysM, partial [Bradyrhizobium sp.]
MSRVAELLRSRRVPQLAVLTLMSVGFSGCSADMSTRLSQNYSNPFASEPQATGSVPTPAVERRELPQYSRPQNQNQHQQQYQSQALPPPAVATPHSYPAASNGVSGGGRGLSS